MIQRELYQKLILACPLTSYNYYKKCAIKMRNTNHLLYKKLYKSGYFLRHYFACALYSHLQTTLYRVE